VPTSTDVPEPVCPLAAVVLLVLVEVLVFASPEVFN